MNRMKNTINKQSSVLDNKTYTEAFEIIKASLWGARIDIGSVSYETYDFFKGHSIIALPSLVLKDIEMPTDLRIIWEKGILQQVANYCKCKYAESTLQITAPYVILKGTAAAKYYPNPNLRSMGDIDIITSHEDFNIACQQLIDSGYKPTKDNNSREIVFEKNGITIELHRYFSLLPNSVKSRYLDELIISNINDSHILPDFINGLVLIEHINQHMEGGIGLRQVIDWMLFVNAYVNEETWPLVLKPLVIIGLDKLAITVTKMCELYIGLPEQSWTISADISLCEQLMDYIMKSGNFGNMRNDEQSISENVFTIARTPKTTFQLLQKRGLVNWEFSKRHKWSKPFAWVYQMLRYFSRGINRSEASKKILSEFREAQKRNALFDALGVKRVSEGHVVFRDGDYYIE